MSRASGATIPLFSIRTRTDWGIGEIVDLPACAAWLASAGQRLVQVLPAHELAGGETSPYGALSAFALDPIYVAVPRVPELDDATIAVALGPDGLAELARVRAAAAVDYRGVRALKRRALGAAFRVFLERELGARDASPRASAFRAFVAREAGWLRDHALYAALRASHQDHGWSTWPAAERDRAPEIVAVAAAPIDDGALGTRVLEQMYLQWLAHEQWDRAREEMRALGVALMGDMPFIVGSESADVWAHRSQFLTDVSLGAPPDDFSAEGQSWGLPAYAWEAMDQDDLAWLRARARHAAALFDRFRIDHVVGFFRQWVRKGGDKGTFYPEDEPAQRARGAKVLHAMVEAAGPGVVIAEDLGVIPPWVRETLTAMGVPGYKVLPWERDASFQPHDPRQFPELSVATWSTHDTMPITSWWDVMEPWERERLAKLADMPDGLSVEERELRLLGLLFAAKSDLVLVLVNELLGDRTRINMPGTVTPENWTWRLPRPLEDLREDAALRARFDRIRELVSASGRA
jgi:4-alpha-glucanotransferase